MSDDEKQMTEAEDIAAGRVVLAAALAALGVLPEIEETDREDIAKRVLFSLMAADRAIESEQDRLRKEKNNDRVYLSVSPDEAVATAFWMWSEDVELDVSEACPRSAVGARFLGFAQGLAAARAMSDAMDLMDDGSFAFCANGAVFLLGSGV